MSKYIIKNCPCIKHSDEIEIDNRCMSTQDDAYFFCEDNTDCIMKQIVEKCKKYIENYNDKVFYDEDDVKILMGKVMLSQSILSEFLEIQEVK